MLTTLLFSAAQAGAKSNIATAIVILAILVLRRWIIETFGSGDRR